MNINRYNYEEYFLLYVDNELSKSEQQELEAFVHANPDLAEELEMLKQSKLKPDNGITFGNIGALLKPETSGSFISEANYEEFFLLYADNELAPQERREVELFAAENPALQQELNLLMMAKAEPDTDIIFPDKSLLYKEEAGKERGAIVIRFWRVAAVAAMILFAIGILWLNTPGVDNPGLAANDNGQNNNTTMQGAQGKANSANESNANEGNANESNANEGNPNQNNNANSKNEALAANETSRNSAEEIVAGKQNTNQPDVTNQQHLSRDLAQQASANRSKTGKDRLINNKSNELSADRQIARNEINVRNGDERGNPIVTTADRTISGTTNASRIEENTGSASFNTGREMASLTSAVKIPDPMIQTAASIVNPVPETDSDVYIANTTANRKLRGLFRKVTRVFEKTTNLPAVEEKGLLIGGFEIALK